jgi:hemoglobin
MKPKQPQVPSLSPEIYAAMGEENWHNLLLEFYQRLKESAIAPMFPEDITYPAQKAAWFFIQISGGPDNYSQNRGTPMMRKRHMAFGIKEEDRKVWLATFHGVLDEACQRFGFPEDHLPAFRKYLNQFSHWMVTQV